VSRGGLTVMTVRASEKTNDRFKRQNHCGVLKSGTVIEPSSASVKPGLHPYPLRRIWSGTVPFWGVDGVSTTSPDSVRKGPTMTEHTSAALGTALAYYRAWSAGDFDEAMTYIAEDIACQAPAGHLEGIEAFRGFMGPFAQIVNTSNLIAAFGDDTTAVLMYDTETIPVQDAPGAECLTVADGKITHIRIIFDRLPFDVARRPAPGGEPVGDQ